MVKTDPVPMILTCPCCRARHIDEGEFATKIHHTHSCQACGLTWRPAVVPTVGVQFLPGFKTILVQVPGAADVAGEEVAGQSDEARQFRMECDEARRERDVALAEVGILRQELEDCRNVSDAEIARLRSPTPSAAVGVLLPEVTVSVDRSNIDTAVDVLLGGHFIFDHANELRAEWHAANLRTALTALWPPAPDAGEVERVQRVADAALSRRLEEAYRKGWREAAAGPHYSGDASSKFWERVGALKVGGDGVYKDGVSLQNVEDAVLKRLAAAEAADGRLLLKGHVQVGDKCVEVTSEDVLRAKFDVHGKLVDLQIFDAGGNFVRPRGDKP